MSKPACNTMCNATITPPAAPSATQRAARNTPQRATPMRPPRGGLAAFGFSLLELMITVAVVAILASVAAPSYFSYVRDARRDDAKRALLEAAQTMESFYAMNMTYIGASSGSSPTIFSAKVPKEGSDHYYNLTLDPAPTAVSYTLKAVPVGGQANDRCGTLSFTRAGAKFAAQADCW